MVTSLHRTLDQELLALARGASLECLVCGEFVQHRLGAIACPECGCVLREGRAERSALAGTQLEFDMQAG
jgi:hypothetical protein